MARKKKPEPKPLPPITSCCSICKKEFRGNTTIGYKDGWGWFCIEHAYNGFNFSRTLEEYLSKVTPKNRHNEIDFVVEGKEII